MGIGGYQPPIKHCIYPTSANLVIVYEILRYNYYKRGRIQREMAFLSMYPSPFPDLNN